MRNSSYLAAAICGAFALSASAGTVSLTDSSITGPTGVAGTDYLKWKLATPTSLTQDNAAAMSLILQGNAASPQGNIELFADSEVGPYGGVSAGGAFALQPRTSFSGSLQGVAVTVSSVNGTDWFNTPGPHTTTYGGSANNDTLARKWFNDFFSIYNFDGVLAAAGVSGGTIAAERVGLFNSFVLANGFQRISDPNVSYVNQDDITNVVSIGLAGNQSYLDGLVDGYVALTPNLTSGQRLAVQAALALVDVNASEVVRVTYNGETQYLYGFSATSTGLSTDDPTESYGQNFDVTFQGVPEPASLSVLAIGAALGLRRRR